MGTTSSAHGFISGINRRLNRLASWCSQFTSTGSLAERPSCRGYHLRWLRTVTQACRPDLLTAKAVRRLQDGMREAVEEEQDERQHRQSPDAHHDEERTIFPIPVDANLEERRSEGAGTFPTAREALSGQLAPGDHFGAAVEVALEDFHGSQVDRGIGGRINAHLRTAGSAFEVQDGEIRGDGGGFVNPSL